LVSSCFWDFIDQFKYLFCMLHSALSVKLILSLSDPQLTPATVQIQYCNSLNSICSLFWLYIWDHYIHNLYISWFISSNEILSIIRLIMMSLWRHSAPNFTECYIFWKCVYLTIIWDHYIHNLYISWFISSNEIHQ
jgi:hypothetical protein